MHPAHFHVVGKGFSQNALSFLQVLLQPQSPAVRGQEALSRVCFVLEQILRQRNKGAAIISDYKYKENYLRHAPQDVLEVLQRPTEEGSHDILMIAPEIGIVCVQVGMSRGSVQFYFFLRGVPAGSP